MERRNGMKKWTNWDKNNSKNGKKGGEIADNLNLFSSVLTFIVYRFRRPCHVIFAGCV